jgi:hypothetical protein
MPLYFLIECNVTVSLHRYAICMYSNSFRPYCEGFFCNWLLQSWETGKDVKGHSVLLTKRDREDFVTVPFLDEDDDEVTDKAADTLLGLPQEGHRNIPIKLW